MAESMILPGIGCKGAERDRNDTGLNTSSQRRLGPQRVKGSVFFTPWGPSLRWGDEDGGAAALLIRAASPEAG